MQNVTIEIDDVWKLHLIFRQTQNTSFLYNNINKSYANLKYLLFSCSDEYPMFTWAANVT